MRRRERESEELRSITIRLPESLVKAAKIHAIECGKTLQELVRETLVDRLKRQKKEERR